MDVKLSWSLLLYVLTLQVTCETRLLKQDLALLVPEENPKCFSRDLKDFTCFWEAFEEKAYDFFYITEHEINCNTTLQKTEGGKVLYICSFPPSDVYIFTETDVKLVDKDTNTTIFTCSFYVEHQLLLDPPSNVYLNQTGVPGQILATWQVPSGFLNDFRYELRHFSNASQDTITNVKTFETQKHEFLLTLVPGETYTVQLRLKPDGVYQGYWSDWSAPVRAIVPQSADDIELWCHTPDLQHVQCLWKEGPYKDLKLHYRHKNRGNWGSWMICNTSGAQCIFCGEEDTMFHIYLTAHFKLFSQTFYMDKFLMNNSIKTEAPVGLKEEHEGGRLCLRWNCPLPQISQYMMYQVRYQLQGETEWKFFTVETAKTYTCLDVQASGQYSIQIKAMPSGSLYSGQWSDWSKPLMCSKTTLINTGLLFIAGVSVVLLILSIVIISYFPRYVSKVKEFLWPPVPNLNSILDSFLKDINGQNWEPNISNKLCDDDIPASVVEIMSEKEVQIMSKPTNCHYTSRQNFLAGDSNGEHTVDVLAMSREYVTLKTNDAPSCLTGNDYVVALNGQLGEHYCVPSHCSALFPASSNSILNQSYLQADIKSIHMSSGHYTNLENAVTGKSKEQASG